MKIEIMDLLHKIYNLDDMPGKIIFDNCVWRYCSEFQDYQSERGYLFGDYMSHINETVKFLNDKVEILEEDKPIIEKLDTTSENTLFTMECFTGIPEKAQDWNFNILKDKLNQIIDYINKKENK